MAVSFSVFAQTNETTKVLLDSTSLKYNSRKIVLIETDTMLVVANYNDFADNLKSFIKQHDLDEDKDLLKIFSADQSKTIHADSLIKTTKLKPRLAFRTAELLESGKCLVYHKRKRQLEKLVKVEHFSTPSINGRKIKTSDNYIILETIDGVF